MDAVNGIQTSKSESPSMTEDNTLIEWYSDTHIQEKGLISVQKDGSLQISINMYSGSIPPEKATQLAALIILRVVGVRDEGIL
jgi:hypothetical protein